MRLLVSVVVPIYNVEKYLIHCVQTIQHQSYKNIEIILVDDGSPDNCGRICDEFAKQDQRVKAIHKQNGGLSDARNAGIDIAAGDYITFIDSDDFIMPDMIETLMNLITDKNTDIAQCNYTRRQDDHIEKIKQDPDLKNQCKVYSENRMLAYLKDNKIMTMAWGKIYKMSLFHNIKFPVERLHEDVFTTYKLVHEANSVAVTDYVGYIYRMNDNSITTSKFTPKKLDIVYGKIEQSEFIVRNYPELSKQAYSGIVYACNQCLLQMARCKYNSETEDTFLQKLYRQYGKYYLCDNVSFMGKIVVMLAMINEHFAKTLLSLKR